MGNGSAEGTNKQDPLDLELVTELKDVLPEMLPPHVRLFADKKDHLAIRVSEELVGWQAGIQDQAVLDPNVGSEQSG
jgi:hypothetical protein